MKIGFGGSCHWCTEAIFQSLIGVSKVEQGWISSIEVNTLSEAVIVYFDQSKISLNTLIEIHLHTHSCTSRHSLRTKYRSAVYVFNDTQQILAKNILESFQSDFELPIITEVLTFAFFKLNKEDYLDYYYRDPERAFCKNQITPKLKKLIFQFAEKIDQNKLKLK